MLKQEVRKKQLQSILFVNVLKYFKNIKTNLFYMIRSTRKVPFVAYHLFEKINKMKKSGKNDTIKTWSRASVILPSMVGFTIAVYNGRQHVPLFINDQLIGHRLGEFVPTRTFRSHKKLKTNDRKAKRK